MQRPEHAPVIPPVLRPECPAMVSLAPDILFVPIHTDDQMSVRIWFPKGPLDSPSLNPMATRLADRLAVCGAGGLGTQGFHEARTRALCHLNVHTTSQSSEIHLKCPVASFERGLTLMDTLRSAPDFEPTVLENIRKKRIVEIKYEERDPWYCSALSIAGRVWVEHSTRARWAVDRMEDYNTATLNEVRLSWRDRFQTTHPIILCAGPMAPDVALGNLRTTFSSATRAAPIQDSAPCMPRPGTVIMVNAFDEQAFLRLDLVVPNSRDNELAANVAAYALNGLYGRMAKVLRLEKGWTYHCDAFTNCVGDHILVTVGCSVQANVVDEALHFMQNTLQGLRFGVSESELEAWKQCEASDGWYGAFVSSNHTLALSALLDKGIAPEDRPDRIRATYTQTHAQTNHTLEVWDYEQMFTTIIRPE